MSDNPRDFSKEFDLAQAEDSGRNLASIIVAFRDTLTKELLPSEIVDELTVAYGTGIIARVLLMSTLPTEEEEE